jgi:hypothetical protein
MYRVAKMGILSAWLYRISLLLTCSNWRPEQDAGSRFAMTCRAGIQRIAKPTGRRHYSQTDSAQQTSRSRSPARQLELDVHKMDVASRRAFQRRDLMPWPRASSWIRRVILYCSNSATLPFLLATSLCACWKVDARSVSE